MVIQQCNMRQYYYDSACISEIDSLCILFFYHEICVNSWNSVEISMIFEMLRNLHDTVFGTLRTKISTGHPEIKNEAIRLT